MSAKDEMTTFDNLVSQLSDTERQYLFGKMRSANVNPEAASMQSAHYSSMGDGEEGQNLVAILKHRSLFYRLSLWVRSMIFSKTIEELFDNDRVVAIAKRLSAEFPDLIDYKRKRLLGGFCKKINELHSAASFFRPYLGEVYRNLGVFYIYMGSTIAPEVATKMNSEVNPTSVLFNKESTSETRSSLLRKMEEIIKEIPHAKRNMMYECATAIEWLHQFVRLHFDNLISSFAKDADGSQCISFRAAYKELAAFAEILCNGKTIPVEALEILYLFSVKKRGGETAVSDEKAVDFMQKASMQLTLIHLFINTVPLRYVNKVVFGSSRITPESFSGAENWFAIYKEEWKRLFDEKWKQHIRNIHMENIGKQIYETFGLDAFPSLPYIPWSGAGVDFFYENTAAFLLWFTTQKIANTLAPFQILLIEGKFVDMQNLQEFSQTMGGFEIVRKGMSNFSVDISPNGEKGRTLQDFGKRQNHSVGEEKQFDAIMLEFDNSIQEIRDVFCNSVRSLQRIMAGVFGEKKDARYDGIFNLASIQGKDNAVFRNSLVECRDIFNSALIVLTELEQMELIA